MVQLGLLQFGTAYFVAALLFAFEFFGFFFRAGWLNEEEVVDNFLVDAAHHVFEKNEGFFLEFDERIFLSVAAKVDAFFQVIEREQVIFPLSIHAIENDAALEPAHHFQAE